MLIIHKSDQALLDLEELAFYISGHNFKAAEQFLLAVQETLDALATHPKLGVERTYNNPALHRLRMFPVTGYGNFLLFYFPIKNNQGLELIRVLHGSRDMSSLFSK